MIYDSMVFLQNNAHIFARHNLLEVISILPQRPVFMTSLYLNYLLTGMDPYYYRLCNAFILAATGTVLVLFFTILWETPGLQVRGTKADKRALSIFLALVFVVHPLQTLAVLYIWQRQALMACFFCYSALTAYLAVQSGRLGRIPGYSLTAILFAAGILSKENVIILPVMLVLADLILIRRSLLQASRRTLTVGIITIPPLVVSVLVTHLMHDSQSLTPQGIFTRLQGFYESCGLNPVQVVLTGCRVLFTYLATVLAPPTDGVQLMEVETVSRSLWEPPVTAVAVAGVLGLVAAALALARKRPLPAFGVLFFVVALTPELILIPLFLYFGYRAILPMPGLLLVVGSGIPGLLDSMRARLPARSFAPMALAIAALPVLYLSGVSFSQAKLWRPLTFWGTAFSRLPPLSQNVEPIPYLQILLHYGIQLVESGRPSEAIEVLKRAVAPFVDEAGTGQAPTPEERVAADHFRAVLKDHPGVTAALLQLGVAYLSTGEVGEGIRYIGLAVRRDPRNEAVRIALATALMERGNTTQAMEQLHIALKLNPESLPALINLGLASRQSGDLAEAIAYFERAIRVDPGSAFAYSNLGLALDQVGDVRLALANQRKAAQLKPNSPEILFHLGNALLKSNDLAEAIKSFQQAVALKPDFAPANANLGAALLSAGRAAEAIPCFKRALQVLKENAELHNALGVALAETGRIPDAAEHFRKALALDPAHEGARQNLDGIAGKGREE